MRLPTLRTARLILRPQRDQDLEALIRIVTAPESREWWGVIEDEEKLRRDIRQDGTAFTIEIDGEVAGWLGVWEEEDPQYRHAGLDIMLAAEQQGRGIGPEALRTAARWLFKERGHHRLTIDPAAANERAIRAYESIGFRRVGVMREYDRAPDGGWRDGMLMEMLAGELRD